MRLRNRVGPKKQPRWPRPALLSIRSICAEKKKETVALFPFSFSPLVASMSDCGGILWPIIKAVALRTPRRGTGAITNDRRPSGAEIAPEGSSIESIESI